MIDVDTPALLLDRDVIPWDAVIRLERGDVLVRT